MQPDAPAPPADRPAMAAMAWRLTHVLALPLKAAARRIGVTTGEYLEWLAWEVRRRDSEEFAQAKWTSDVTAIHPENHSTIYQERAGREGPVGMEHLALHATEVLARYRTGETEELARRFDTSGRTVRKFLLRLEDRDAA